MTVQVGIAEFGRIGRPVLRHVLGTIDRQLKEV